MKKSKLLIAVLAATMFVLSAFGLIACDKDAGDLGGATTPTGVYTITLNYGEGSGTLSSTVTANGKIVTLPAPTAPNGKKFDAWYDAATGGKKVTTSTTFDKNATIYARYTDNTTVTTGVYTVTFNYNGGTGTPASAQTTDGKLTLTALPTPATAPDGKTFDAWYDAAEGGNKVDLNKVYTEPTTIFAQYTGGQVEQPKEDGAYDGDTMLTATVAVNPENENELMITGLVLDTDTYVSIVYNEEVMTIGAEISGGAIGTIASDGKSVMLAAGTYDLYYSFGGDDVTKLWASKAGGGDVSGDVQDIGSSGVWLVGEGIPGGGWGKGVELIQNGSVWTATVYVTNTGWLKIRNGGTSDSNGTSWVANADAGYTNYPGDNNFWVNESGTYTFSFDGEKVTVTPA